MAGRRPDLVTPLQAGPLACAIAIGWKALWGAPPSRAAVLTLLAQIRHETGFRSCHAYNLGNFKSVDGDGRDWVEFQTWERDKSGARVATMAKFRAYPSLEAGVVDYLASLKGRYGNAWQFVLAGDPVAFVHALKAQGYFTDTEATYATDVLRAYGVFNASLQFDCNPPYIDPRTAENVAALVDITSRDVNADVLTPLTPNDVTTMPDPRPLEDTRPDLATLPRRDDEA